MLLLLRQLGGKLGNSQELIKSEKKSKQNSRQRCGNNSVKGEQAEVLDFDTYMSLCVLACQRRRLAGFKGTLWILKKSGGECSHCLG